MTSVDQARAWPDYRELVTLIASRVCPNKRIGPCPECIDDSEHFLIGQLDYRWIDQAPFKQAAEEVVADAI